MPVEYRRAIARQITPRNLVVTLTENGLTIRRKRGRKPIFYSFEQILSLDPEADTISHAAELAAGKKALEQLAGPAVPPAVDATAPPTLREKIETELKVFSG